MDDVEEYACPDCGVLATEECAPWCTWAEQTQAQIDAATAADVWIDEEQEAA